MISDLEVLKEIRESWDGVRNIHGIVYRSIVGSVGSAPFVIFIADIAHNLPFLHACSVLNDVLEQLRDEGEFKCNGRTLGKLAHASKDKLPWADFNLVKELIDHRNSLAHKGQILPRGDCWEYIDAIEEQLLGWNILD